MRHSTALLLSLLTVAFLPSCAIPQVSESSNSATSKLAFTFSDSAYCVTGYCGAETIITIPNAYDDGKHGSLPVTAVAEQAFKNQGSIVSISLPKTLETIGDFAFANCWSLSSMNLLSQVSCSRVPFRMAGRGRPQSGSINISF